MTLHVFTRKSLVAALLASVAALTTTSSYPRAQSALPANTARFAVGDGPEGVAFDGSSIWVANEFGNSVTKLSSDGAVLGTFPVGRRPVGVAADRGVVWVANYLSNTVTKLGASDGAVLGTFPVGDGPGGIACHDNSIWVTNRNSNTVMRLQASDGAVLGTYRVGRRPMGVAVSQTVGATDSTHYVWVANNQSNTVTKLRESDGLVMATYKVGDGPFGVAFDGTSVWVANFFSQTVMKLGSDGTVLGTFLTGDGATDVVFDGSNIWVANNGGNSVTKLRAADGAVLQNIDLGGGPFGMAFDGSSLWVSNFSSDAVSKVANVKVAPRLPADLVLALGFNEPGGPSVFDASAAGNTGTITGATRSAGKDGFGTALSFNGVTDWVSVAPAASLDLVDAMTLEAWVNPSALTGGAAGWRTVILKEQTSADLAYSLYANDGDVNPSRPAGYVRVGFIDRAAAAGPGLPLNTWSHLAATYDGTTLRLFVNGVLKNSVAVTGPIVTSSNPLRIGGNSVWGEYFKGLIDEVRIYRRPLTEMEVRADMATPLP